MPIQRKILQIGIDGATWQLINPLLKVGQLPNLKGLIDRGTSGILHSSEYSASPIVWTTMATGKGPEKHGVQDFYTSQSELRAKRIWELFSEQGETVGVYNFLLTWPPKTLNGFVIPDWLALDESTHPPELRFIKALRFSEKLGTNHWSDYIRYGLQALGHGMRPSTAQKALFYLLRRRKDWDPLDYRFHAHLIDIPLHTDFFCHLLRRYRPKFAATVYYHVDAAAHFYWKYMEPELFARVTPEEAAKYGHVIPALYRALDNALGRILRTAGDDYTVLVVSDHGTGPATHPSTYLYRPKLTNLLERSGYSTDQIHALIGLDFYLNLLDQPSELQSAESLIAFLTGITIADTGEQVFEVCKFSDQYLVVRIKTAHPKYKDAMVQLPTGETYQYSELVSTNEKTSGTHHPEGIFILAGPGIKAGHTIENATLVDVTPTMLALLGMPIGRDMDGQVLVDALEQDFLAMHSISYLDSYETQPNEEKNVPETLPRLDPEQQKILKKQLQSLGYLE